jgi:hypothetical protein
MSVQVSSNNSSVPFVRAGFSKTKTGQTLKQDAGRTLPLAPYTVLAKVAATGKYVPFTDETAVDGSAVPCGIYLAESIAASAIVAGDVVGITVLVGDAIVDAAQLVIENAKTINTVVNAGNAISLTVGDLLELRGIFAESTVDIDNFENA